MKLKQNDGEENLNIEMVAARPTDGNELAVLRVEAMRESLEAVGRFDEQRARDRFLMTFTPTSTDKIMRADKLIGFLVVRILENHVHLDHLYIIKSEQGHGIGAMAMDHVKARAQSLSLPIRLCALVSI